mmetsp:Transcript_65628/g.106390  ORF Transcript_65628/g.106390 Transcript_65628/m.106390 type:complete len:80 (-) Transcript_65628:233-472(-)
MYCECVDVCIYIFSNIGSMILQQHENEYIHTCVCENARTSSQPPFLSHTHAHIYIYVGQFGCEANGTVAKEKSSSFEGN